MQASAKKMLKEALMDHFVPDPMEIASSLSQQVSSNLGLETEEMIRQRKLKELQKERNIQKIHYAVMTTALALAVSIIFVEWNLVCFIAFSILIFNAPYATYQRRQLFKMKSVREWVFELRLTTQALNLENEKLHSHVSELESEVSRLKPIATSLETIVAEQDEDIDEIHLLTKQHSEIMDKMDKLLKGRVLHVIMKILLLSDRDKNFEFNDSEIDTIILRMSLVPGLTMDETKLKTALNRLKGGKVEMFGKLSRDIFSRDSSEYGISFHD